MVSAYCQHLPYDQSDELIRMGFKNHLTNWLFRISRISINIYSQFKPHVFHHPENDYVDLSENEQIGFV